MPENTSGTISLLGNVHPDKSLPICEIGRVCHGIMLITIRPEIAKAHNASTEYYVPESYIACPICKGIGCPSCGGSGPLYDTDTILSPLPPSLVALIKKAMKNNSGQVVEKITNQC
jgi:hypothetical protein